ncbi:MAG: hypothetical protein GTN89_09965 [Acidobacteria bacterium]|nr:hypothetical protein [Acidobacteriota bacterium]NIQ30680.1 hypothetical protein [Acidobacteriota bacterium]NIQ85638.1 hypothetical protein [Acidobacteriota bacterium]
MTRYAKKAARLLVLALFVTLAVTLMACGTTANGGPKPVVTVYATPT